jgi:hypothetical protein
MDGGPDARSFVTPQSIQLSLEHTSHNQLRVRKSASIRFRKSGSRGGGREKEPREGAHQHPPDAPPPTRATERKRRVERNRLFRKSKRVSRASNSV